MGSMQSTADFIVDQIAKAGDVSAKKMFGEYGVYCDGKMVAVICDDQLYFKPTAAGKAYLGTPQEASPFPKAKPFFYIDGEFWDDAAWLAGLARVTAQALPLKAPKKTPAKLPKKK
jgi:DNA transformation protein